ncbi:tyrosine-protein phosphatase 2-like [Saccostrea echinata]|uniref:tyrosine-protein phosphatase 2-like n=1 Tax=Saccostrea echinata TaxID=191078 RepID=UPI002A8222D8|nr:tyrosine-protein phosphatase 2-like [Saccostrea echinata]
MVCDPGYYGRNCVQECSVNCGGTRQCDRLTGECEGGCRPGWKGMQCDQSSSMTSNSDSGKENNELGDNDYIDDDEIIHAENSYGDMCFNKNTLEGIIQHNQRDDDDGFKHEYAGINKTNEYIAAQGPLQNTVEDFWIMICQEYVNHIVMLTNLKEGNKLKGSRIVTESRVVTHYHYTAWPEHGIPEPLCLADFHDHVTRTKDKGYYSGPTLVHCSSGTGRTGTYIAIDALYKAGKTERKVNIAEYVKKMRENRMNMVQTYEQYKTIFLAIEVMFRIPAYKHTKPEFVKQAGLRDWYKSPDERELKQKLQSLLRARPSYTEDDYKLARENGDKSAVLPRE